MGDDSYGYAYDPLGNRTVTAENTETTEYVVNNLNQYTNILCVPASLRLNHDADGNLLTNGVWSFTWDAENRLVSACSNNVLLVTNTYDPRSRRIRKEVFTFSEATGNFEPVTCNAFLWDGWNVIREVRQSNIPSFQSSTNYYTWGVDLSGSLQGAGGVGGLLSVTTTDTDSGTSTNYYPVHDANGNVTAYLDAGGSAVAAFEYDAFGNTVSESGSLSDAFTHRFSTKPFDAEAGLVMYQLRPYEPGHGRWLSRDPIEERGGINLYTVCKNNMISGVDAFGLVYSIYAIRADAHLKTSRKNKDYGHEWLEVVGNTFGWWPKGFVSGNLLIDVLFGVEGEINRGFSQDPYSSFKSCCYRMGHIEEKNRRIARRRQQGEKM